MKIKRYQSGGIYYTPFFRDSVTQTASQDTTDTTTSKSKDDELIQKEIINTLKENGLPNDVDYFLSKANSFLRKSQNLGSLFTGTGTSSYDMSDLVRIQSLANRIKHNNRLYEQASKQIIDQGSGSEVAITNTGNLYVYDENGIKTISTSTYHKNPNKYQILTNSELIRLREEQPELAFNGTILTDLSNTVGMKSIVDYVKSTIGAFGTNKSSSQLDKYTAKQKGQIEKGFEQLLGFTSPDGIYKITSSTETANQGYSDEESLNMAINYLYRTLPNNMKNVLKANAAAEGLNPNDSKDVQKLLTMAVIEHTNHSNDIKQSISYDGTASKSGSGSSGSTKSEDLTREQMMAEGKTTERSQITINASDGSAGIVVTAGKYGKPMDTSGKQLGRQTLTDLFTKDRGLGSTGILSSVSFGDQLLNESDLDRVVYDGVSDIERVKLPINQAVFASTGKIVPDLDATKRFEEFLNWYDSNPDASSNKVVMKLQELDLDVYQDENGNWVPKDSKYFYVVNGYASNKAFDFNDNSKWVSHVDRDEGDKIYDIYERLLNYGSEGVDKSKRKVTNFTGGWFGNANSMYKSAIFIPISDPAVATVTSGHEKVPEEYMFDIQNRNRLLQESRIRTNW